MMVNLTVRDIQRLSGVHPDLQRVIRRVSVISPIDFMVLEGMRTQQRQRELMASGATTTLNSRHLTGHAVDIAPMVGKEVRWDWPLYHQLARFVKEAAKIENVVVEWGGDWVRFRDGPHWQLPFKSYPS